ncbi:MULTISPECIES: hypothetical protein [Bradyrhizobium]|uniref:hypothetical protein n=1 Tax=Bradyrhizobium TaxID=374 RepID=UPI000400384B|nr:MULTISPECIES: hypothetical protein [Bradyrhizobium]WLB87440.1 hypothetical protein QIH91_32465 [Bradyrhizobium japonicum USDA 135]GLR98034.1 hypothetical protein GCM10007858_56760 [Bradyrhizobium liaoningense]
MTAFLIFSFLTGAVLGQRFRVFVLLPVTFALVLTMLPVSMMTSLGFLDGMKTAAFAAIALQGGYLFGSAARFGLAAARATRVFGRPVKATR